MKKRITAGNVRLKRAYEKPARDDESGSATTLRAGRSSGAGTSADRIFATITSCSTNRQRSLPP